MRALEQGIDVGIQLGNVSFTFRTDYEGSNVKTAVKAIKKIASTNSQLFKSLRAENDGTTSSRRFEPQDSARRKGKAETSLILGKLEEILIPRGYFKIARTTGDAKVELEKQTGIPFTSRKVSQALGVLFEKKVLARVGTKGSFRYIQQ